MKAIIIKACTHDDKEYAIGDIVKNAKVAKVLIAAGMAEEVTEV